MSELKQLFVDIKDLEEGDLFFAIGNPWSGNPFITDTGALQKIIEKRSDIIRSEVVIAGSGPAAYEPRRKRVHDPVHGKVIKIAIN